MFILYWYSCGSQVERPNHRVVIRVRRDLSCPSEVMKIYLTVLKMEACLAYWCRGKPFQSPRIVWRHWWHLRSQISHYSRLTFFQPVRGFSGAWMALRARNASQANLRLWTPKARATDLNQGPNCARGSGGLPAVHGAESTRKDSWPEEQKKAEGLKKHITIYFEV